MASILVVSWLTPDQVCFAKVIISTLGNSYKLTLSSPDNDSILHVLSQTGINKIPMAYLKMINNEPFKEAISWGVRGEKPAAPVGSGPEKQEGSSPCWFRRRGSGSRSPGWAQAHTLAVTFFFFPFLYLSLLFFSLRCLTLETSIENTTHTNNNKMISLIQIIEV